MSITTVIQAVMIVVGLALGALWPRGGKALAVFSRDALINVATGAALFPIRLGLTTLGVRLAQGAQPGLSGLLDLGSLEAPAIQFLFTFVLLDFSKYWLHRADHGIPILWSFHRVHHSTEHIDATAGLRMHVVDFLQLTAVPVVLFGVLLDISDFAEWVLPAAIGVGIVADAFSHMHVEFPYRNPACRALLYAFNNPLFHSWHHTRDGVLCDGNYANALPIWDLLFRSDVTQPEPPQWYGIGGDQRLANDVLGLQLLRPRTD
ncbi:MAG: sterol desaturase family protein [Myxococcales bacterium]|nr:sterol desaturase family protein [Myxococcales bacterium]